MEVETGGVYVIIAVTWVTCLTLSLNLTPSYIHHLSLSPSTAFLQGDAENRPITWGATF